MLRSTALCLWLLAASMGGSGVLALFEEEAGQLDFVIASSGHGPTKTCAVAGSVLVTSDGTFDAFGDSCYLAARSIEDGKLLWRRNVCLDSSTPQGYRLSFQNDAVSTLDRAGMLQVWDFESGSLNVQVPGSTTLDASSSSSSSVASFSDSKKGAECAANGAKISYSPSEGTISTSFTSEFALTKEDAVNIMSLVSCSKESASFFVGTKRGTSLLLEVSNGQGVVKWSVEEGLGSIDAAILMDASSTVDNIDQEEGEKLLTLHSRIELQLKNVIDLFSGGSGGMGREQFFGFVKVAVLLSTKTNRLFGIDTSPKAKSLFRYIVDLPDAMWHKIIRGSSNAISSVNGIGGGTNSRDILVVSYSAQEKGIHWKCLEGTTGVESAGDFAKLSAPVVQIIPLHSHAVCRQSAALVLEDNSVVIVPSDPSTQKDAMAYMGNSPNGFYTHVVNKEKATVESLLVDPSETSPSVVSMGTTSFPGEDIVTIAYPNREEIVQSPCNALGDQSLLLKYINPHIFVAVTVPSNPSSDPFATLIKSNKEQQKRKPAGVTPAGADSVSNAPEDQPNLFINVVDSVSGRVIHRASHSSASLYPKPSVVVSENWIIYAFANQRTRRSEIGVLSLYEGMIDSKGLTAFSSPERTLAFSSVDAKETKPVVLAKTYSMVKGISAIGMSATGGGISGRRLFVATVSGSIYGIDRKMLEPRRPLSKVKDTEQKEGLRQYDELLPAVSLMSLSHTNTVEGVQGIVSAPTDLESQTLMLAYGGPDIFYARTSPSRGFDLLPESFSRALLSVVVAGLLVVVFVIKQRVSKKVKDQGWV